MLSDRHRLSSVPASPISSDLQQNRRLNAISTGCGSSLRKNEIRYPAQSMSTSSPGCAVCLSACAACKISRGGHEVTTLLCWALWIEGPQPGHVCTFEHGALKRCDAMFRLLPPAPLIAAALAPVSTRPARTHMFKSIKVKFRPRQNVHGPGLEAVNNNYLACHSAGMIPDQPTAERSVAGGRFTRSSRPSRLRYRHKAFRAPNA